MKFLFFTVSVLFITNTGVSQDKYDRHWITGYLPNNQALKVGGTMIQFNPAPEVSFLELPGEMGESSIMSDKNGNLLFYSNGCRVYNRNHKVMVASDTLNPGWYWDNYCDFNPPFAYPLPQGILTLPWPGNDQKYLIFHLLKDLIPGTWGTAVQQLYSVVDMTGDGGLGAVVSKNNVLAQGVFMQEVSAVRHANGRDWWIINGHQNGKTYNIYLFSPEGIQGPKVFTSTDVPSPHFNASQVAFSPDGSYFAQTEGFNTCRLSRFDRCAGELYDVYDINFGADSLGIMGVSFSPNSKVMYISTPPRIYQFDLTSNNIAASKQIVAVWDGTVDPYATNFYQCQLGLDNKIYIGGGNGIACLHIIHHPDSIGLACAVEQRGLVLPTYNYFIMPNVPHYRLYDLPGSVCDSLGINTPVNTTAPTPAPVDITFYPNPATDHLTVSSTAGHIRRWQVSDLSGRLLDKGEVARDRQVVNIPVWRYPGGAYILTVMLDNGGAAARVFQVGD
jgi:hypothetical protein